MHRSFEINRHACIHWSLTSLKARQLWKKYDSIKLTQPLIQNKLEQTEALLCFAPVRVKVKHHDYDPIGTYLTEAHRQRVGTLKTWHTYIHVQLSCTGNVSAFTAMTDKFRDSWTKSIWFNWAFPSLCIDAAVCPWESAMTSVNRSWQWQKKVLGPNVLPAAFETLCDLIACWEQLSCNCTVEWGGRSCGEMLEHNLKWSRVQRYLFMVTYSIHLSCRESSLSCWRELQIPIFQFRSEPLTVLRITAWVALAGSHDFPMIFYMNHVHVI